MRSNIIAAVILAVGLIVGGFLAGGRYSMHVIDSQTAIRLDHWTGDISMCVFAVAGSEDSCGWKLDSPPTKNSN